jgi:predicted nucleic acid-binding protein
LSAIVDASPLIAWANRRDARHRETVAALGTLAGDYIVAALCLAEAAHVVAERAGPLAEVALIRAVARLEVIAPSTADLHRMAELMEQYADWPLGAADASIVALAERLGIETIVTFDRRHFAAVQPRHIRAFRVLPE